MNLAQLGETFRRARLAVNLTQDQVAELSGVARPRVSQFENGSLPELGAVKLLSLFDAVGLELYARPAGHQRTLDDAAAETAHVGPQPAADTDRRRVRSSAVQPGSSKTPRRRE
ncbi:helix-turn-helix domain-containing protein [Paraburkholderia phosphatilytica]|uniref:helix-turn-helix domain-containing protein n=1 Tax=Paraburkholderia phosphatilytica TaxID=2282883 RepID=UPI000E490812|nr:helix-turn-helix domain-containing protein [Paraburkholderia phosphatilytica]